MKLRTRLAALVVMVGIVLGVGATTQANASLPALATPASSETNGCIVFPALQLAICIPRF